MRLMSIQCGRLVRVLLEVGVFCDERLLSSLVLCACCFVSLPEWSKWLRSGRNVFERVGSNPTADILYARQRTQRHVNHAIDR